MNQLSELCQLYYDKIVSAVIESNVTLKLGFILKTS